MYADDIILVASGAYREPPTDKTLLAFVDPKGHEELYGEYRMRGDRIGSTYSTIRSTSKSRGRSWSLATVNENKIHWPGTMLITFSHLTIEHVLISGFHDMERSQSRKKKRECKKQSSFSVTPPFLCLQATHFESQVQDILYSIHWDYFQQASLKLFAPTPTHTMTPLALSFSFLKNQFYL